MPQPDLLLIEDDEAIAELIVWHFAREGFSVRQTPDGEQALVGSHNFDLRSAYINIELGLLFREPELVAELRAQGLVNWTGGQVEILDWPRLAAIAEFDPAYLRLQREPV